MPPEKILVTGAAGKVGRELVPLLVEQGVDVKAGTRNPAAARQLFPPEVELVELNYAHTATYDDALAWADRVFLMPPPFTPEADQVVGAFVDWAVSVRVSHVVLVSGMALPDRDDLALNRVERHVRGQDTAHTVLRPNLYMQNFHPGFIGAQIRESGAIRLPAGDGATSLVDVRDVAAVAAVALTGTTLHGRTCTLTGGEAVGLARAARLISEATGRQVRYEDVSEEAFRQLLSDEGWSPGEVEVILGLFSSIREGARAPVHPDISEILGHPPRSFGAFVTEHAEAWR